MMMEYMQDLFLPYLEPELQLEGLWRKSRGWTAGKKTKSIKTQAKTTAVSLSQSDFFLKNNDSAGEIFLASPGFLCYNFFKALIHIYGMWTVKHVRSIIESFFLFIAEDMLLLTQN